MRPATRMMLMSNGRNGQVNGGGGNYDSRSGMEQPRYNEDWVGNKVKEHRNDPMEHEGRGMNRDRGYDHGREHHRGYDDDEERDKPQRMYAAGMAWTEGEQDKHREHKEVDEECAMKWVKKMKAADGSTMPHFKPDMAEQMRMAYCPDCKKWEWFVAINMMYADYAEVAKKLGVDRDDYYAHMAKAFLTDEDAGPHKLAKYMEAIPKK